MLILHQRLQNIRTQILGQNFIQIIRQDVINANNFGPIHLSYSSTYQHKHWGFQPPKSCSCGICHFNFATITSLADLELQESWELSDLYHNQRSIIRTLRYPEKKFKLFNSEKENKFSYRKKKTLLHTRNRYLFYYQNCFKHIKL